MGPRQVAEFDAAVGAVTTYEITPEEVGIARGTLADIAGGDAEENARIVRLVLEGEHGSRRDVVLMNAGGGAPGSGGRR